MQYFDKDFLTLPKIQEVELTIFGNGSGESILTYIPTIGWGLIDCCTVNIEKEKVVPALQYLHELHHGELPDLAFVIITHPHEDHYQGIDTFLDNYKGNINRLCRYAADGIPEFQTYISQESVAARSVPRLKHMLDAFKRRTEKDAKITYLNDATFLCNNSNVHVEGFGPTSIQLRSLSPSAESTDIYRQLLYKSLAKTGNIYTSLPKNNHNLVSVALLLTIGEINILYSGDVENGDDNPKTGWQGIISDDNLPSLSVDVIKVSHHGSVNGHSDKAWEKHIAHKMPYSMIAPYTRHNLPQQKQIEKLILLSKQIGFSSQHKSYSQLTKLYSKELALSISSFLNAPKLVSPLNKIGAARIRISIDGKKQTTATHGSGFWIKK